MSRSFRRDTSDGSDEENPVDSSQVQPPGISALRKLYALCRSKFLEITGIKHITDVKLMHRDGLDLVKRLCKQVTGSHNSSAPSPILKRSFLLAAQHGIKEIIEEILVLRPDAIADFLDEEGHSAVHLAVMYRQKNIFNVIIQRVISLKKLSLSTDKKGNNILHLAGYRAHQQRLDLVSRAVLQMQPELHWYKAVEKFVPVQATKAKNHDDKTPLMVFNEEHSDMIKSEGQWVAAMANSCTVSTTIIGTIAFAAAITVPGGNKADGLPLFSQKKAFIVFYISNSIALFTTISTLITFLSILTLRYAAIDFLRTLPNRLIIGLFFLFFSVMSMIIAFTATIYLVLPHEYKQVAALAGLPVVLFVFWQFPLLANMVKSTYGNNIFSPP